jgi:plasmid maintenance system antidote protein VapI
MVELRRADTALAEWLAHAMARWINPQTQMPGISQRRLAEETGVSQTQLHAIIKKGHSPGPEILIKFADFFGANPMSLFALAYLSDMVSTTSPIPSSRGETGSRTASATKEGSRYSASRAGHRCTPFGAWQGPSSKTGHLFEPGASRVCWGLGWAWSYGGKLASMSSRAYHNSAGGRWWWRPAGRFCLM